MVLPLVVRGRWLAVDLMGAALCATGLVAAHVALGDALAARWRSTSPRGAVAGGIAAALLVVRRRAIWRARDGTLASAAHDHGLGLLCEAR